MRVIEPMTSYEIEFASEEESAIRCARGVISELIKKMKEYHCDCLGSREDMVDPKFINEFEMIEDELETLIELLNEGDLEIR